MSGILTFQLTVTDNSDLTSSDTVNIVVDVPPVAAAGPDQTVLKGTAVNLSGSGSSDTDGAIAAYTWVQTAGTPVVLTGANTANPGFTAPDISGTITLQLTVRDDLGATKSDDVNIIVNASPVVNAGPEQTVLTDSQVILNGTGSSDPDGSIAAYAWVQTAGTTVTLAGADTATPNFTAPNASGSLTFALTVTDNHGARATASVILLVNRAPSANAGTDQMVLANSPVTLSGTASSDIDGAISAYAWTQTAGTAITLAGADMAIPNFTAPNVSGILTFQLTVTDNQGATSSDLVNVTVNLPPIANAGPDQLAKVKSSVSLSSAASSDPDGTISSYTWTQTAGSPVTLSGQNTPLATFVAPGIEGALTFQLTVADNRNALASDQVVITVTKTGR
ncbi:MAG: hypothetical protein A2078_02755 [Nitrospirae bacterium GWC2_57_9]|nr:MAG: hypothetical protein A2078_02755 [Nitrospirae bacterium GWC2_57_9]